MKVQDMTREDFKKVHWRKNFMSKVKPFKSLVIIPTDEVHDEPVERLSGCSDVLHINGIGGYGNWRSLDMPRLVPPIAWSIDCLKGSGFLRLFCGRVLTCGDALSSFEVFAEDKKKGT